MPRPLQYLPKDRHAHKTLRMRGDIVHTFGSLFAPLAIFLVFLGFYLLGSAVAHPLTTDPASLILASMILALGFVLLSYLLRTAMISRHVTRMAQTRTRKSFPEQLVSPVSLVPRDEQAPQALPFHRSYVDSARVRR